jgi:hypothetical protein
MDDRAKKFFSQLDDPEIGQRQGALEMLHLHLGKSKTSFCDLLGKIERGEQYDALDQEAAGLRRQLGEELKARAEVEAERDAAEADLEQHKDAVLKWKRAYAVQGAKLATANAIAWGRMAGRKMFILIGVPLIAFGAWQGYERYWPLPAPVQSGLQEIALNSAWGRGCGQPVVRRAGGTPYWVLACGRIDSTSHLTADGRPVGLHCLDLYATPAVADAHEYVKADPYGLFGWWMKWPRRAVECTPFDNKEAQE